MLAVTPIPSVPPRRKEIGHSLSLAVAPAGNEPETRELKPTALSLPIVNGNPFVRLLFLTGENQSLHGLL